MKHHNHTQILFLSGAWTAVPANTDLVWTTRSAVCAMCMCKDDKVLTALQMEMVCHRLRFWRFLGTSDPEWVLLELLDESGSKF